MPPTTTIQQALEALKAGDKDTARSLLIPLLEENHDNAEAWYLLAFTLPNQQHRLECFQEVLRIDPNNQAAQKQIARLTGAQPAAPVNAEPPRPQPPANTHPPARPKTAARQSAPQKPARAKRSFPIEVALGIVGVLIILGIVGVYLWNGMNTNQKVAGLFAQGKCSEVVGYASFGNSFPRAIFNSMFGVYQQVEECQAKLALDQALGAKDWATAHVTIGNYLALHPNGTYAAEMQAQAEEIVLTWTKELAAQNDYRTAIEKLKSFQASYPASPALPVVVTTMLDDYILWAKAAFDQKDFESAEQYLKVVNSHPQASPAQVQQANQGLAVVYLQWGKTEIESGKLEEGKQHYDAAQQLNPGLADFERLKNQAQLTRIEALAAKNNFDKALTEIKTVLEAALSEGSKADAEATRAKILDLYAHSNAQQAQEKMSAAANSMCQKQAPDPELPIFGLDADRVRLVVVAPFTIDLSSGPWLANTPAELHYVLCIAETQDVVETCKYTGGYKLRRVRFTWDLDLYELATGKLYKSTHLQGSNPDRCGSQEWFASGSNFKDVFGGRPLIEQIENWLRSLKLNL